MSGILFVNGTAHGHINPTLPVAGELARRGETVYYCSTAEFKEQIEAVGALFLDCGPELSGYLKSYRPGGNHPFYTLMEFLLDQDIVMARIVSELAKDMRIDCIVHDAMLGGGWIASRQLGVPAICVSSSFAASSLPVPPSLLQPGSNPQLDGILRKLEDFREASSLPFTLQDVFFQKEARNIVFTSRAFQADGGAFNDSFHFVGPSIDESRDAGEPLPNGLSSDALVYISMGTINNDAVPLYRNCMQAFAGSAMEVILSVGYKMDMELLGTVPENVHPYRHVPQLAVLKKAKAFISHGGLNSVSEALYYGVPVLALPQVNDQPAVTRRLTALGAGLELKVAEATPSRIRQAVETLVCDPSYRAASLRIGESFRQAGGYRAAADNILSFIRPQAQNAFSYTR